MEEQIKEQKRIFNRFIKVFTTEESLQGLDRLLTSFENREIENALNELKEIQQKMQGDEESGEMPIQEAIDDIYLSQKRIDEIYWKIFDLKEGDKNTSSVLNEIESIKQFAIKMRESYRRFYDTQDSEGNVTQGLITKLDEACKKIEGNKDKFDRIDKYYAELFEGVQADENGKGGKLSLEGFIKEKQKTMNDLISTQKESFEASLKTKEGDYQTSLNNFEVKSQELIVNKEKLIDELLPGATSAGLATAYQKERQNIETKLKSWQWIFSISIIAFLVCFGIYFYTTFDEGFTYVSFLKSLPFWVFSGFFTFFSTKQISEYKRLASEYAYKEALNTTYVGYEKAIQESGKQELKDKLLEIMIQTAEFNPSTTLGKVHGEHPMSSFINRTKDFLSTTSTSKQNNVE